MIELLTVTGAAAECGEVCGEPVRAREVSDLLYQRKLNPSRCPIVGRVRLIPRDYLSEVKRVLQEVRQRRLAAKLGLEAAHAQ
jgi:hypothetical protein